MRSTPTARARSLSVKAVLESNTAWHSGLGSSYYICVALIWWCGSPGTWFCTCDTSSQVNNYTPNIPISVSVDIVARFQFLETFPRNLRKHTGSIVCSSNLNTDGEVLVELVISAICGVNIWWKWTNRQVDYIKYPKTWTLASYKSIFSSL